MSTARIDKSALPDATYHWTTVKARVFLGALAEFGNIAEAARQVGMTRQSAYRLRDRLGNASLFGKAWEQALEVGRGRRRARAKMTRKVTVLPPESDIFGLGK